MLGLSSGQMMDDNEATGFSETSIYFYQDLRINISEYRAVKVFGNEENEVVRSVMQHTERISALYALRN
jgi:hypothetical protein